MCKNFEKKKEEDFGLVFVVTTQKTHFQKLPPNSPLFERTRCFKHVVIAEIYPWNSVLLRFSCLGQMEQGLMSNDRAAFPPAAAKGFP